MGHGKNKKTQKVGLGQERKETKEERRLRLEEEAKAREVCRRRAACDQSTPIVLARMSKIVVVMCSDILTSQFERDWFFRGGCLVDSFSHMLSFSCCTIQAHFIKHANYMSKLNFHPF